MNYYFITGAYRSGTTLLQKLIGADKRFFSLEQPLPTAFIHIKKRFLEDLGYQDPLPLGTLFHEQRYRYEDFTYFLHNLLISEYDIDRIFSMAEGFDGVKTPEILNIKNRIPQGIPLIEFYKIYLDKLHTILFPESQPLYQGSKEIICEEYIEYFLSNNVKTLLIIRDPRDMINSANFGKANKYLGSVRPTLFSIRVWRKSVATVLHFRHNKSFLAIRYEDLILETEKTLSKIYNFFGLPVPDLEEIFHNLSKNWTANSSFGQYKGLSSQSIGKFKNNFPDYYTKYIELMAYPEMKIMGYETLFIKDKDYTKSNIQNAFNEFTEPVEVNHKLFDNNYSFNTSNQRLEIERYKALLADNFSQPRDFFIFEDVYKSLKQVING